MNKLPLGDMPLTTFLRDYWQKKPLLIRNAITDFEPIIDADELAGLACEEEVESRLIVQQNDRQAWSMQHGPLSENDFANLPDSHWTLLVQAVDHWHPKASDFLKQFQFIPQWRIDDLMISYATQGGGVGPHYDNYDVFLLQASGSREWQYGGLFNQDSPRQDNQELMLLADWAAETTVTLHPGDMLYIPPRVGHNGIAKSDDCITYSIGFRAPSHTDVLLNFSDFVAGDLSAELSYQDPHLTAQPQSAEIGTAAIAQVKNILRQYIEQPGLVEQWFGCYMTEHKYNQQQQELHLDNSVDEIIEAMQESNSISKIPGTRLAFQYKDNDSKASMLFFINGMCCQITTEQQDFIISLTNTEQIAMQDILSNPERVKLMANLIKIGAFELQ